MRFNFLYLFFFFHIFHQGRFNCGHKQPLCFVFTNLVSSIKWDGIISPQTSIKQLVWSDHSCHMIFISRSSNANFSEHLKKTSPPCWIKNKRKLYKSKRFQGQQGTWISTSLYSVTLTLLLDEQCLNCGTNNNKHTLRVRMHNTKRSSSAGIKLGTWHRVESAWMNEGTSSLYVH